ncbi:MAG: hypothetical protein LQ346_006455, partial [Caloplaca aetnensis]
MSPTITADQWEQRKEEILRLYIDEGLTLKPIQRKLESADFRPTESQYRTKLKKWKRRKPRQRRQTQATTDCSLPSTTAPTPSNGICAEDESPAHESPVHSVTESINQAQPFTAEELMLADASCHSANLWHGSPGYLADTFETATTGQAQRSLPDIGCVDSQQRDSIYVDQSYEYAYPDPGEYLNLSKIRRAQSTYGSPGQARVERGPRWRTQSTTQQPKDFLPASSTDQSYPYPYLPAHMAGIGQQAAGADCSPGFALLKSPYHNKGSAFPPEERETFKLYGLLPPNVQTLEEQVARAYQQYSSRTGALAKNTFMTSMKDQNQVLYYKLIQDHLKEMFSIIYTPTEGDAIQNFSRIFRQPEGCFLNIFDRDRVYDNLAQWGTADEIDYIVVTDGEEILGIGDQGVGGILISVAKLVITTVCAGIHPARTLPVVLDCGTDNHQLLNDELYLGIRRPRIRGQEYEEFIDSFVQSARKLYPKAYIHLFILPSRSIHLVQQVPCFNDDIQGTGCITLAAVMAGLHVSDVKLKDMRMVVFGSGSAGTGIADQVRDAIATESGISEEEAAKQI